MYYLLKKDCQYGNETLKANSRYYKRIERNNTRVVLMEIDLKTGNIKDKSKIILNPVEFIQYIESEVFEITKDLPVVKH